MILWETSPTSYKQVYFEGKKIPVNRGMALGKEIAEALENDEETGDITKDLVIAQLPKYDLRDKEIRMDLKVENDIVPLLIKPDSIRTDYSALYEYKTGSTKWNAKKVNNDPQLTFYATGIEILTGKIPTLELIWAPTEMITGEDGIARPKLTGEILHFETTRKRLDIINMKIRMRKAWREIGEMVTNEIV